MTADPTNKADAAEAVTFGEIDAPIVVDAPLTADDIPWAETPSGYQAMPAVESESVENAEVEAYEEAVEADLLDDSDADIESAVVDIEEADEEQEPSEAAEESDGDSDSLGAVEAEPEEPAAVPEPEPELTFTERVDLKIPSLRYANNLHRAILTPQEKERLRTADRRAAVWVPISTFLIIAVCAALAVILAIQIVGDANTSSGARAATVAVFAVIIGACFWGLVKSQDYFDRQRPRGRVVRADLADAYEVVRDAPHLLVELGANQQVLDRVSLLLPAADHLINMIVEHQANTNLPVKGHPLYNEMIRMSAEVQVLIELQEERSGHRAIWDGHRWVLLGTKDGENAALFPSLADLATSLGVPDAQMRAEEQHKAEIAAQWKKPIDPNLRRIAQARVIVKE